MSNLNRRAVLALGTGSALALAAGARASTRMISLGFNSAPGGPQQVGADAFNREIAERTGGQLIIDERGGVTLGSENALVAAAQSGALDLTVVSGPVVGPVVPEFGVFDVPFLFRDSAHVKAVAEGPIGARIAAAFGSKGLTLLAIGEQGFRNVTNSRHKVTVPADLKGLRIRVLPNETYKMTFRAFGADAVPMEFPLVYSALKDGRIDGEENPVVIIAANRFQDVQKYLTLTGHFYAPVAFIMNRDSYQSLDPAMQTTVSEAAKAAAEATRSASAKAISRSLAELKQGGMQVTEHFDRQAFIEAVNVLEPEFEQRFGKEMLIAIRSTR